MLSPDLQALPGAPSSPQVDLLSGLNALREEDRTCSRPPCRLEWTRLRVLNAPKVLTDQLWGLRALPERTGEGKEE